MSELIATLDASGEFDALAKLRPGEPYFVLIGRDTTAPALVEEWADQNRKRAIADFNADPPGISRERYERECRKSTQAEMKAADMRAYKRDGGKRLPHEGEQSANPVTGDAKQSYNGVELPEETKRRDAIQAARYRAASALNGAVAALNNLRELKPEEVFIYALDAAMKAMDELSDHITPPRVGIKG